MCLYLYSFHGEYSFLLGFYQSATSIFSMGDELCFTYIESLLFVCIGVLVFRIGNLQAISPLDVPTKVFFLTVLIKHFFPNISPENMAYQSFTDHQRIDGRTCGWEERVIYRGYFVAMDAKNLPTQYFY